MTTANFTQTHIGPDEVKTREPFGEGGKCYHHVLNEMAEDTEVVRDFEEEFTELQARLDSDEATHEDRFDMMICLQKQSIAVAERALAAERTTQVLLTHLIGYESSNQWNAMQERKANGKANGEAQTNGQRPGRQPSRYARSSK
ncbi:MAG: hypothetical protein CL759_09215 [Chloroflexi bacterium]|nr:hypothetical protein [Chloroflexota bacterium]|tara:strand:+ start:597 stop:1028 length:432 start_codon:yes stop_codon:yes gene_type:complete